MEPEWDPRLLIPDLPIMEIREIIEEEILLTVPF